MDPHSERSPLPPAEFVIAPNHAWLRLNWAEIAEHRDLLFLLVRRDLVAKYKQTILGPLWHVIQPIAMALALTGVLGGLGAIPTEGVPRPLFYLCGLLVWNYFALNINTTSATFTANAELFGKVYFPRLVVPLAVVLSNLVAMALQFAVFILFFAAYSMGTSAGGFGIGWSVLFLPALVVQAAALSLGAGLVLSALTARYRDLQHAMPFVVSILMFLTPVIYPLSEVSAESRWMFQLNPMSAVVEAFRHVLLGVGEVEPAALASSIVLTVATLLVGVALFQRAERNVVDTV